LRIEVDTHVHTVVSDHAHSTITEVIAAAAEYGLKGIVETEHGPRVIGAPPVFYFSSTFVPKVRDGVRVYFGCEANILAGSGDLDVFAEQMRRMDFVVAGLHSPVMPPSNRGYHTRALINTIKNPLVDCIAHPENPNYPIDMRVVAKAAAKHEKLLEVNNNSFLVRKGGEQTFRDMLSACMDEGVRIAVASDAHIDCEVGRVEQSMELIEAVGFPKESIVNLTMERFEEYLEERRARVQAFVDSGQIVFDGIAF
jgi:putative hydrolase